MKKNLDLKPTRSPEVLSRYNAYDFSFLLSLCANLRHYINFTHTAVSFSSATMKNSFEPLENAKAISKELMGGRFLTLQRVTKK